MKGNAMERLRTYAFKTLRAMQNYYGSVETVYPLALDKITEKTGYYIGLKDTAHLAPEVFDRLEQLGYYLHTIDKSSLGGRAIDVALKNPITGKPMTGSSSGTAMNVFLGINDLGIGTDGGGSVLAPATALNLCACIHPDLFREPGATKQVKKSTDGIPFSPSFGMMGRNLDIIRQVMVLEDLLAVDVPKDSLFVGIDNEISNLLGIGQEFVERLDCEGKHEMPRKDLIACLNQWLDEYRLIITEEGPIDLVGMGDTVFGHFDEQTQQIQQDGKKGFLRVVNMCQAFGLIVPTGELSRGYLLICKSTDKEAIAYAFELATKIGHPEDNLSRQYFEEAKNYFEIGVHFGR